MLHNNEILITKARILTTCSCATPHIVLHSTRNPATIVEYRSTPATSSTDKGLRTHNLDTRLQVINSKMQRGSLRVTFCLQGFKEHAGHKDNNQLLGTLGLLVGLSATAERHDLQPRLCLHHGANNKRIYNLRPRCVEGPTELHVVANANGPDEQ